MIMVGHLYIVKIREFVKTEEDVYKVGRTFDIIKRFSSYPKGSKLLFIIPSDDPIKHENILLDKLRNEFKNRTDIGREYFQTDLSNLIKIMISCVFKHKSCKEKYTQTREVLETWEEEFLNPFEKFTCKGKK